MAAVNLALVFICWPCISIAYGIRPDEVQPTETRLYYCNQKNKKKRKFYLQNKKKRRKKNLFLFLFLDPSLSIRLLSLPLAIVMLTFLPCRQTLEPTWDWWEVFFLFFSISLAFDRHYPTCPLGFYSGGECRKNSLSFRFSYYYFILSQSENPSDQLLAGCQPCWPSGLIGP